MMKFPTPKGVATLVTRRIIISECRRLEKKQMVKEENPERKGEVAVTEEVLVNPSFPDQLVTIGGYGLSKAGKDQLKSLLRDNMGVFVWEPSDMIGVSRRIIEHTLNVNPSLDHGTDQLEKDKNKAQNDKTPTRNGKDCENKANAKPREESQSVKNQQKSQLVKVQVNPEVKKSTSQGI
ncbi:hypothetical protein Tco_0506492 [Tanacetum coccineum]